jgi:hypothetical protein
MKVFTNTDIIESRAKWARRVAPLTMFFLVAGLITNFLSIRQPEYFRLTLLLLALGFIFATISSTLVNRWVREPRADQVLDSMLKKFGNDFVLFNYTSSIPHILLTPSRLYSIVVKNHDGEITINQYKAHRKFTWRRLYRLMADEGLGSPVGEAETYASKLQKILDKELPGETRVPEIQPLVIFANKEVDLTVNNPPIPVIRTNQFKSYIRENNKSKNISADQRKTLADILGGRWQEGDSG